MDALQVAATHVGGVAELAKRCGVTRAAVYFWHRRLPPDRAIDVARACEWKVRPHELRPDLYPHEDDGVPAEYRNRQKAAA